MFSKVPYLRDLPPKWQWVLYAFGIFMLAPLTLLLLMGFGELVSCFANPSALGPPIILVFPVIVLIAARILRRFLGRKGPAARDRM